MEYIVLLLVFASYYGAGLLRKTNKEKRRQSTKVNSKEGSLSEAIVELIAFAGGIYLSLTLLIEFLALNGLDRLCLWGVSFDPIALASVILALLQPIYERIRFKYI